MSLAPHRPGGEAPALIEAALAMVALAFRGRYHGEARAQRLDVAELACMDAARAALRQSPPAVPVAIEALSIALGVWARAIEQGTFARQHRLPHSPATELAAESQCRVILRHARRTVKRWTAERSTP